MINKMINRNLYEKVENIDGSISFTPYDFDKITILGKNLEEIRTIISGLEFERLSNIELTMENVNKIIELYKKEQLDIQNKYIQNMLKRNSD